MSSIPKIAIIGGCGHVGLPLGIAFADRAKADVTLVDVNESAVARVNKGNLLFSEEGGEGALRRVVGKNLRATTNPSAVRDSEFVIIITGTPVDEYLNPRVSCVIQVIDQYLCQLKTGQLIILRSTLAPGLTEFIDKHIRSQKKGLGVAFCPERVEQGHAIEELYRFPQIVSAFDFESENRAAALFQTVAPEILRLLPPEAELVKLFANAWRYMSFAIANQHYMIAEGSGLSFRRIYEAITYHYPRAKDFARSGFTAGPCLFKDTMQLSAFCNNQFFLGHAAMLVNEGLPNFVVSLLEKKLGSLEGKKVGLLGMAFKPNHDDTRESLSYKVKKILTFKRAIVLDTDVFQLSANKLGKILKTADAFILGVPHRQYLDLDLGQKPFVDPWGIWEKTPMLSVSPHEEKALSAA